MTYCPDYIPQIGTYPLCARYLKSTVLYILHSGPDEATLETLFKKRLILETKDLCPSLKYSQILACCAPRDLKMNNNLQSCFFVILFEIIELTSSQFGAIVSSKKV